MDFFSLITLVGGLAFFLYGMNVMSSGLERMAGGQLECALKKMTSNPLMSLLLGAGITIAIQSSSAVTVMLVGLVNSGIMEIGQTVGVIMGSNIGTTLTTWLLSLVALDSGNIFVQLLKPENFSLLFALVGILLILGSKKSKKKDIGSILIGFAILMYGMKLMSDSVEPLADMPEFAHLLTAFQNPILGVLVGAVFTGIIQSSAASVGILQALSMTGNITYGMAIPIIMGQNIGTCVTALISSIGVNRNARKVSVIHISFNVIGTAIFLTLYLIASHFLDLLFLDSPINTFGISACHSVFNLATTLILLPFGKTLVKIANFICDRGAKDAPKSSQPDLLDMQRLLATPSIAISECNNITNQMSMIAQETLLQAISLTNQYDNAAADNVVSNEALLDKYEDQLGTYLVQVSAKSVSEEDSLKVSKMLHAIGDFERLGDHALKLLNAGKELSEKHLTFSESAKKELDILTAAIEEIVSLTTAAYTANDPQTAKKVEPLEQTIDRIVAMIRANHIHRLQAGECSIELGFILSDMLGNYERISDHCSNIAVLIIELEHKSFDTHKYLNGVKYGNRAFNEQYEFYCDKYHI